MPLSAIHPRALAFVTACCGLLLSASVLAQGWPSTVLPPPAIDAPGVQPAPAASTLPADAASTGLPTPGIVPHDQPPPTVHIRKAGHSVVQEYRSGGHVYMIKVIPPRGPTQTYRDVNGDGLLDLRPGQAPVNPVFYTLYEWGKPKPLPDEDDSDSD